MPVPRYNYCSPLDNNSNDSGIANRYYDEDSSDDANTYARFIVIGVDSLRAYTDKPSFGVNSDKLEFLIEVTNDTLVTQSQCNNWPNEAFKSILRKCLQRQDKYGIKTIIDETLSHYVGQIENGEPLLHLAVEFNHDDLLDAVMNYDGFVDYPDVNGNTPLKKAVAQGKTHFVKKLLGWGADATFVNSEDIVIEHWLKLSRIVNRKSAKRMLPTSHDELHRRLEKAGIYVDNYLLEDIRVVKRMIYLLDDLKEYFDSRRNKPYKKYHYYEMRSLEHLHYCVVGQQVATTIILREISTFRMSDSHRAESVQRRKPLVILCCGPSGHGKTETCESLQTILSKHQGLFFSIDCANHRTVQELFGSGGAYQGSEVGSMLNNFLSANEGKEVVVHLDEFEKTERCAREAFYSVFDTGIFYDKKLREKADGITRKVDCSRVIFCLTTNALDNDVLDIFNVERKNCRDLAWIPKYDTFWELKLRKALRRSFKYPLINRIDKIVTFFPFEKEHTRIITIETINKVIADWKEAPLLQDSGFTYNHDKKNKHFGNVKVTVSAEVHRVVENCYEVEMGARSIIRGVRGLVMNTLCQAWREDRISNNGQVTVDKATDESIIARCL
jgi:hypothetical protein